jgi:glutamate dehydrogenase (NADP+)
MSELIKNLIAKNPGETEFHQAAEEVVKTVQPVIDANPKFVEEKILERMLEPERLISFRVEWTDDKGEIQVNRGYRIQMNSAIGPYKGGLRFHPSVNPSILKFLAFEQVFKNALTTLPLGGGKGGSDFNPKGRSDREVMRFCQSFMNELFRHIGANLDVPAGDIGVGGREIGYLFGTYKKISNEFAGILTGKGHGWGGSNLRPEATGYGLIYFANSMVKNVGDSLEGKTCLVSGSGNVALYAIEKLNSYGSRVISASDSSGYIVDEAGIDTKKLEFLMDLKFTRRGRISEYAQKYTEAKFFEGDRSLDHNPLWDVKADCAFPCATQNEVNKKDAENLVKNGIKLFGEGANMPTSLDGIDIIQKAGVLYSPAKASNAGGVATSGFEMSQNRVGLYWPREKVDARLQEVMKSIHDTSLRVAEKYGQKGDYLAGANMAAFEIVAEAMVAQGVI